MPNLHQMQGCLASGSPFVFGFTVYESFMSPAVASRARLAATVDFPTPPFVLATATMWATPGRAARVANGSRPRPSPAPARQGFACTRLSLASEVQAAPGGR